jgi:cysteinyl-tRNA synthetase
MAKRKGNIKYPNDLLETECIWNHIRFFFIYGHYRRKLDFTFKAYTKECDLLKSFRKMVKKLGASDGAEQESSARAKKLVNQITAGFEENMNNDLHVKAAFDSVYRTVSSLVKLKEEQQLNMEDTKEALAKLKAIDYVLQTIF